MRKVVITGGAGQLGSALAAKLQGYELVRIDIAELDVTDAAAVRRFMQNERPDVVIHAAAFTQVDVCESQPDVAYRVNGDASGYIAEAAAQVDATVVYVSTDYVFDGTKGKAYIESDATNPQSIYGKSKLAGERATAAATPHHFIVRTAWLFGVVGNNFPKAILARAATGNPLQVVNDQTGCPTFASDLAETIGRLIETKAYGTYHATNSGACTWHEFASFLVRESGLQVPVNPMTTAELGRPAPRPAYSVLENQGLHYNLGYTMRPWQEATREFLQAVHNP